MWMDVSAVKNNISVKRKNKIYLEYKEEAY